ncbi:MAG: deoxyribose-phosphate aldolase [Bryobacteraceae bacterium]|nr:deoxyribose-phosphate aldolase [Bryobacteraceae bacterium]
MILAGTAPSNDLISLDLATPQPIHVTSEQAAIAAQIDHTLLKPEATAADIRRICAEARQWRFCSVCVNPYWVSLVAEELQDSAVKVCSVVGFPLGAALPGIKLTEAANAMKDGAREIDMVLNVGELRGGNHDRVQDEIAMLASIVAPTGSLLKVILETALLSDEQKELACRICRQAGAHFVKTSTGFGPGGATVHDVSLMRRVVGPDMGVKASGGIRTLEDFRAMIAAGATRVGASASVAIVKAAEAGASA